MRQRMAINACEPGHQQITSNRESYTRGNLFAFLCSPMVIFAINCVTSSVRSDDISWVAVDFAMGLATQGTAGQAQKCQDIIERVSRGGYISLHILILHIYCYEWMGDYLHVKQSTIAAAFSIDWQCDLRSTYFRQWRGMCKCSCCDLQALNRTAVGTSLCSQF